MSSTDDRRFHVRQHNGLAYEVVYRGEHGEEHVCLCRDQEAAGLIARALEHAVAHKGSPNERGGRFLTGF